MTKPQLSAEMEETKGDILDLFDPKVPYSHFVRVLEKYTQEVIATALEEQKQKVLDEVDEQLRQFQLIYGSFDSSTGDIMGYRISEHEESADVLIRYLRIKLNQLKGSDDQPVRNA